MESAGFSVSHDQLLYDGKPVGNGPTSPGFRQFSFEAVPLGEGGNGVTFRVKHRRLQVDQVVKLYIPDREGVAEKALLESRKNADPEIRDVIAQVHDAGTYSYPKEISYSVMESVSRIQTLKEWICERDKLWKLAQESMEADLGADRRSFQLWKNRQRRHVVADALNVAAGFVGAVVRLHSAEVTHGDLNPGNILILQEATLENRYLGSGGSQAQPGTLKPFFVKVIDLGSSQVVGTGVDIGIARENWFVMDNLRKILKPLFDGKGSVQDWTMLEKYTFEGLVTFVISGTQKPPNPAALSGDLFRLLCVLNVLHGHLHNSRDQGTDVPSQRFKFDHTDLVILNELMGGQLTGHQDSEIFDLDVLAVLRVLHEPTANSLIRWQTLMEHYGRLHSGFRKYEIYDGRIRVAQGTTNKSLTSKTQYDDLHAIVAKTLRSELWNYDHEQNAHEVLQSLREGGLPIPAR